MTRYIPLNERTRPYRITRGLYGWAIWDRRHHVGTSNLGDLLGPISSFAARMHPTHAAAIAALDQHLREQAATEPSA